MLNEIHIRDLATIEELHLNFNTGSTMITGETGAGKSIFIEAIELALGARSSTNIIRPGKERADISLGFAISAIPHVIDYLKKLDFYQDSSECIIRRVITQDGRSRCYINGFPATVQLVKELGEQLFHLHGQHEQQVLLKAENQREILDRYADHLSLATDVKQVAEQWKSVGQHIKSLREKSIEHAQRCDYLRFQLDELQAIKQQPGEWEMLEAEHHRLSHAEELLRQIQHALQHIADNDQGNALTVLNHTRKALESIQAVEPKAQEWTNSLNSTLIQLNDLEAELRHYLEKTELDPQNLRRVEERISQLFNLARKHKTSPQELIPLQERITLELHRLASSDASLTQLETQQKSLAEQYALLAKKLSQGRIKAAIELEKEITTTIRTLSLPHGEFKIELEQTSLHSDEQGEDYFSPHGNEKVIFLIKTNPDQIRQPLAKVISGGELSRLSLAVHLALANQTPVPTLVFDEVDTGLSGATAEKIGKLLRHLGESYQVFCVTHQAQVAACGHHHLFVEKYFLEECSQTRLRLLNTDEKIHEIARMLGGEKMTEKTLEHAKEILAIP